MTRLWREILGDQFITRKRMSRIYYNRKFFHYPLKPVDAFTKLGPFRARRRCSPASCLGRSSGRSAPSGATRTGSSTASAERLFEMFFKTYTEKVWGMSTREITAEWAAQRIKGLDLTKTVLNALFGKQAKGKGEVIKTLIDRFEYPRLGPGQMWEAARDKVREGGSAVHMDAAVESIEHDGSAVTAFVTLDHRGRQTRYLGHHFLSTLPIRSLIRAMTPAAPAEVVAAAEGLKYRDFLTVVLIVDRAETFPDNWIYIHEPEVKLGRVQNFKNWSPDMVPDPSKSSLGLEYFCFEGDDLWTMADSDLVALGRKEIDAIGLVKASEVVDGCVVRMPKAYPVYDETYQAHLTVIRDWLKRFPNLELAGRSNGMHKYNNQDHLDDDRPPRAAEHPRPRVVRHVEGEHRRRVPRRRRGGRRRSLGAEGARPLSLRHSEAPRPFR